MLERLSELRVRIADLERRLADPAVIANADQLAELGRQHAEIAPVVRVMDAYEAAARDAKDAAELLRGEASADEREFYEAQLAEASAEVAALEADLEVLLLPKDPNDTRNVIVEVRAAAGGDEAALFAAEVVRMLARWCERQGFAASVVSTTPTGVGGYKEATLEVRGHGAYSQLKFEGGTHRVQRVPETEASGRIHTSTVTVAVLPEADDVEVHVRPDEVSVDVYRSSGPGGQSVNTTDSAVRLTHLPTGIVVTCQDEKSQLQNREKAMRVLRARLLADERDRQHAEVAADRRAQVGTGERSEKIRTYNFPQNRVTDHRVGVSVHDVTSVLDGDLSAFVSALLAEERARLLGGDDSARARLGVS